MSSRGNAVSAQKKEALDYLPTLAGQKKRDKAITWRELYETWLPTHRAGKSTMDCYKAAEKYFYDIEFWKLADIESAWMNARRAAAQRKI